jgi:hypothetical protein
MITQQITLSTAPTTHLYSNPGFQTLTSGCPNVGVTPGLVTPGTRNTDNPNNTPSEVLPNKEE